MNIHEAWWVDFFNGPFGELQLRDERVQATVRQVDRIVGSIGPAPRRILDAPCGAGRHSLELAQRGYDVVGIDFNPQVLAAARTTAEARGLNAVFQQHDLRHLDVDGEFDAVLCLWTSIGYFSELENEQSLLNLAKAVKPGGTLILDAVVLESLCPKFTARGWSWWGEGEDRVRVCEERTWDAEHARINVRWSFIQNQREETRDSSIRVYTCRELLSILERGGLSSFNCSSSSGGPFQIGSPGLWLEARKGG